MTVIAPESIGWKPGWSRGSDMVECARAASWMRRQPKSIVASFAVRVLFERFTLADSEIWAVVEFHFGSSVLETFERVRAEMGRGA